MLERNAAWEIVSFVNNCVENKDKTFYSSSAAAHLVIRA